MNASVSGLSAVYPFSIVVFVFIVPPIPGWLRLQAGSWIADNSTALKYYKPGLPIETAYFHN